MSGPVFVSLGSPLVDIIAEVTPKFLSKYHFKPNNATVAERHHRDLFRELEKHNPKHQGGGCALNTARIVQWILETPNSSAFIGNVGRDPYAKILSKLLETENVTFIYEQIENLQTGKCAVLLTGDDRSLCTDLGASARFELADLLRGDVWKVVEDAGCCYISAFFFGVSPDCTMHVARFAKTFCFNIGAPFLCERYREEFLEILPHVDVLFGNEAEARALAKIRGHPNTSLKKIVASLSGSKRLVVITRGPKPVLVAQGGLIAEFPVEDRWRIQDTNAAGDAFVGGFLAQKLQNKSLEDCVRCGMWTAVQVMRNIGCNFDRNQKYMSRALEAQ